MVTKSPESVGLGHRSATLRSFCQYFYNSEPADFVSVTKDVSSQFCRTDDKHVTLRGSCHPWESKCSNSHARPAPLPEEAMEIISGRWGRLGLRLANLQLPIRPPRAPRQSRYYEDERPRYNTSCQHCFNKVPYIKMPSLKAISET
ncbi:Hypothetical protein PHPALM_8624 [Phytophthora palmivora]|uniref:Uncharacterized protein n=1 Tax=Phytophthora palmivora TaxID=4796 RepID=A0A2P4Y9E4_9STRA|nr:Hypothetical protein PHPALM_8624 [Phytophthora palmivora]